ncbi:MAG: hypothetical protein ACKOJF_04050, partial [Planctomycetaceae bacterium]
LQGIPVPIRHSVESGPVIVVARGGDDEDLDFEDSPTTHHRRRAAKPSVFVNAIAIIDMILGGMTMIGVTTLALELLPGSQQAASETIPIPVGPVNYLVVVVSAFLGVCSLVASFFLLKGRSTALSFGWGAVALTMLAILLCVLLAIAIVNAMAPAISNQNTRSVATAVGYRAIALAATLRLSFLALYATALVQFKKWLDRNASGPTELPTGQPPGCPAGSS